MSNKRALNQVYDIDLESIQTKISNKNYWSNSIWMESLGAELFNDASSGHDYSKNNNFDKKILKIDEKKCKEATINVDSKKETCDKNEISDFLDLDVQNYVEIGEESNENVQNNHVNTAKNINSEKSEMFNNKKENYIDADFCSFATDDSGIESSNSVFMENESNFIKSTKALLNLVSDVQEIPVGDRCSRLNEDKKILLKKDCKINDQEAKFISNREKVFKIDTETLSELNNAVTMKYSENFKEDNESDKKKYNNTFRKSREVFVSEESPIIEGEFEESRRVTRLLVKNHVPLSAKSIDTTPGKLVWGYFRSGWWPAIIIKAEDAGMIHSTGKVWVSWVGESLISELHMKNVDLFSNKLELRLNNLATNARIKATSNKQRESACLKTIQLLRKHFNCGALVRPYISWIKNNILPQQYKLDDLLFYPYPENLSEKLSNLKKQNFEKNEKYLRQKEKEKEKEKEKLSKATDVKSSMKKIEKLEKPVEEGGINIMDQKPGMIVWAKMQGYSLWPCVIMDYQHLNRKQPNVAHQWVMWYGDYKYSQVEYRQILVFPIGMEKMEAKIQAMKEDLFSKAVLQASKDYCEKLGYLTEPWKIDDVIHLFYKSKDRFKLKQISLDEFNDDDLYSQTIKKQLRKQINNQPVSEERKRLILDYKNLKLVLSNDISLESLCITCFESNEELEEHPFFYASMCNKCLEEFRPKIFAYGNDSKCFYCTLCGGDDLVAMCDNMNCPRVFCTACIKYIICPDYYEEILLMHPWYCFLCDPNALSFKNSIMKIRYDWRKRMISLYRLNCDDNSVSNLERLDRNRKIRVLSLFDGIGTGLTVLKKLNVNIECYYASEIDTDSMQVTFFNHGNEVIQLGDVRNIDEKKIKEISPIDLLIGGSPCNELSLANPKRRGLDDPEGTGILFYDYCRIKKLVKKYNKKRHMFWLFENVASMPKKYRVQISKNLGREPKFLDSADFSAQHRPRLYWGNLPWGPYQVNDVILQDVLRKQCNRQALVKKIMTVTTRTNSLNQTKENLKPVLMDGKKDGLWVTELEEIFGFPMHYTDANLQKTRRLQLIGKAWSVQTLTAILRPVFYL